jgi:GNAT superfamily N-acetyltransferase
MSRGSELLRLVCETYESYFELGNERVELPHARLVRNRETPDVYDANHLSRVRARTPREIEGLLASAEREFADFAHRAVACDPFTPAPFEARLALEGYAPQPTLQLVLEGELRALPPEIEIHRAESESDWRAVARLTRLDHQEQARLQVRPDYPEQLTLDMVAVRRAKSPDLRFWLAGSEGETCAFFSSWPGHNGVGMVEDLFTHPDFRHRGIATALIARAVGDARERGARAVLIGARPDDAVKRMYVSLGFRPICLTRSYVRSGPP